MLRKFISLNVSRHINGRRNRLPVGYRYATVMCRANWPGLESIQAWRTVKSHFLSNYYVVNDIYVSVMEFIHKFCTYHSGVVCRFIIHIKMLSVDKPFCSTWMTNIDGILNGAVTKGLAGSCGTMT